MKEKIEQVARICHETNRAYCITIGDNSQQPWDDAPQWQRESAIKGVEFHVSHLAVGEKPPAWASHNSWLEEKRRDGWRFGPVKDATKKEHPCFVPYPELPIEQRLKDYLFAAIVEAFFDASQEAATSIPARG